MNLHANFKEHMGQKSIVRFWWVSGLSSVSWNHLTTLCRPFTHYACLRLCFAIVHIIQTNCLYFVCFGWSAQLSPKRSFGKHEYDVTNNARQIRMTPYDIEWNHRPMKIFCIRHRITVYKHGSNWSELNPRLQSFKLLALA